MGEETHPAAPLVEVRGKCIQGVDVGDASGVVDVLAWHNPRLHCGQHTHQQLCESHGVLLFVTLQDDLLFFFFGNGGDRTPLFL